MATKVCPKCHKDKDLEDWLGGGSGDHCRACARKLKNAEYKSSGKKRTDAWRSRLSRAYGMTPEQYSELLRSQGGGCAICGACVDKTGRALAVDHCHETGKVRGILCGQCNTGVGNLGDNPSLLRRAAAYVEAHALPIVCA